MSDNHKQWQSLLTELKERTAQAQAMGGEQKVASHKARGHLTARERLSYLFDEDEYQEIGALAGMSHPAGQPPLPGDGVVGGVGYVKGVSVVAMAEDFTVKGGSIGHANAAKRARLVRIAAEQNLPLVLMLEGAGERVGNTLERYPNTPNDLQLVADLKGQVPVVTLIMGASAGHGAITGMFADFIVMLEDAALFTAGPPLVEMSLGIKTTAQELGGALMHAKESGVVHNLASTDTDAIDQAKRYLEFVCARKAETSTVAEQPQPQPQPQPRARLTDIIPPQGNRAYNVKHVIDSITDEFFELQPLYGASMVCGLARMDGRALMIVANQPSVMAGTINTQAALKATHFIEVADHFDLPLLFLIDNPGVMPGPQSEREGILKAAGAMFAAQRRYRGKKIVVTLRKAYGFGSSVMGMNPWDRQAISLALPSVSLGGVPALGSAAVAGASEGDAARIHEIESGAWVPADSMAFDKIVDPDSLRAEISAALLR